MFGSKRGIVLISILAFGFMSVCSVSANEMNYSRPAQKISVQEEFGDYMSIVRDKISKSWTPPDIVEVGHATVVFKLDRNGNVISSYIRESSGNKLYDESALNSIHKASPYADFPANASREYITIQYSFDSSIVTRNEIQELVQQSEKYVNRDNKMALEILDRAIKAIEGDPSSYFLYARRHKLDKLMGDEQAAKQDLAESKRLKGLYNQRRIQKCREALAQDETPFAYFTLANAYELAGDYQNALYNIDKAISMTALNQAYKRYRAEIVMKNSEESL